MNFTHNTFIPPKGHKKIQIIQDELRKVHSGFAFCLPSLWQDGLGNEELLPLESGIL